MPTARINNPTSTNNPTRSSVQVSCLRCAMNSSCSFPRLLPQPCTHIGLGPSFASAAQYLPTNSPSPAFLPPQPIKFPQETAANTRPSTPPSPRAHPRNKLVLLDKPRI